MDPDMAHESARSINGPYLEALGASATLVGLVAVRGAHWLWLAPRLRLLRHSSRTASWIFRRATAQPSASRCGDFR